MELNLRSFDPIEVHGAKVPRYLGEKLGLVPVTIARCVRAFADDVGLSHPHLLFSCHAREIFRPENYSAPRRPYWGKYLVMKDESGADVIAFWPQLF
jgi:hypothetical protein